MMSITCRACSAVTGVGLPVPHPVDELHDVLEDVRLGDLAMRPDDVREHAHLPVPVGRRRAERQLAAGEVERLAVEQDAADLAVRSEVAGGREVLDHGSARRAVRDREGAVAEVEQRDGVVVHLGFDAAAAELPARAAPCRTAP